MGALEQRADGLPPPVSGRVDVLLVAGEHSGDEHAARVLRELLAKQPGLKVCALGGPRLAGAGAQLLRDLTAGSAMGFAVLAKISHYRKLITDIVEWVDHWNDDPKPFIWHKTADEILDRLGRYYAAVTTTEFDSESA